MRFKVDIKPLEELRGHMVDAQRAMDAMAKEEVNRIADRHLARCKKGTAVGMSPDSPTLQPSWQRSGVVASGDCAATADVFNPTEYASYYEYGHRQQVGRVVFIPLRQGDRRYGQVAKEVKSGKHAGECGIFLRLKSPYVKGAFVMTDSEEKAQQELNAAAKRIEKRIREAFK